MEQPLLHHFDAGPFSSQNNVAGMLHIISILVATNLPLFPCFLARPSWTNAWRFIIHDKFWAWATLHADCVIKEYVDIKKVTVQAQADTAF